MSLPHFSRKQSLIDNALYKNSYTKFYENPTDGWVATPGSHNNVISTDFLLRTLKMGPIDFSKTSITNYQSALRNIPQQRRYAKIFV